MTTPWRKSSRSGGNTNSQCVEARTMAGQFEVRDSKTPDLGTLNMLADDWQRFLAHVRR